MPYVNIKITKEGATAKQKADIIKGVTDVIVGVLNKDPNGTFVVIDEVALEDWGVGGLPVKEYRAAKAGAAAKPVDAPARKAPVKAAAAASKAEKSTAGAKPAAKPAAKRKA